MRSPDPYRYPLTVHQRKHGPAGYSHYREYRDWLRDEFDFRCVYCLQRERWGQLKGEFDLDHFEPQAIRPDLALDYDNLVYACHSCNFDKGSRLLPDPHVHAYGACLRIEDDGGILPLNDEGEIIIDELDLDSESRCEWRSLVISSVGMATRLGNQEIIRQWMSLPTTLPQLNGLQPPNGNCRLTGLLQTWQARRHGGTEPVVFEV